MSDEQILVSRLIRGEPDSLDRIYRAHSSHIRGFLANHVRNRAVVDDLTQETFLQIWSRPHGFDPAKASIRSYLFGIARKIAADWWRQNRESQGVESVQGREQEPTAISVLLQDALGRLDADARSLLWLREVEGYSYDELASILQIPIGTVRSRLFTAREQLRRVWSGGADDSGKESNELPGS